MSKAIKSMDEYDGIIAFFDEMHVLPSEKKKRIATARKFKEKIHEWLLIVYSDIKNGYFLHEKRREDYVDDLIALYVSMVGSVDKDSIYDTEVNAKATRFANYIQDANENIVKSDDFNDGQFKMSVLMGIKVPEELVPSYIKYDFGGDEYGDYRSERIGNSETNWIYNYLSHKKKVASGQLYHTWETMQDEKVRGTHALADGQTVPIDEPFTVGGYKLLFPTDDSLGASPSETINCRCLEI